MHTEHLTADRVLIRSCLAEAQGPCEDIIQAGCRGAYSEDAQSGALNRQCDWRAIAAWEDEMNAALAALRTELHGRDLTNLEASQHAWDASMLADVGLAMDMFEGGTMSGQMGAFVRARATAARVLYLTQILDSIRS